jgi:hypothetical protein
MVSVTDSPKEVGFGVTVMAWAQRDAGRVCASNAKAPKRIKEEVNRLIGFG